MVSPFMWIRYAVHKLEYSIVAGWKYYEKGAINEREFTDVVWKNLLQGNMSSLHWYKGEEMVPTIGSQGGTLLVRKIPHPDPTYVHISSFYFLLHHCLSYYIL